MITIGTAIPGTPAYEHASCFAQAAYADRLHASIAGNPDVFAYAHREHRIIGCFGLYKGVTRQPLLFETYIPDALERIAGQPHVNRDQFGELGTRAVSIPKDMPVRSGDVSLGLAATLIMLSHRMGIRYLGFTADRRVSLITDALCLTLIDLGAPDLSGMSEEFLANWRAFFHAKPRCFGFRNESTAGCASALHRLAVHGICAVDPDNPYPVA